MRKQSQKVEEYKKKKKKKKKGWLFGLVIFCVEPKLKKQLLNN
jgi:hypothetical protein